MKEKTYMLNTFLALVLTAVLTAAIALRTFAPWIILPRMDIPNMVLISLFALLLDHYLAPGARRCYICIPVFSAIAFGLLPYAACLVNLMDALKLGASGCVVFTATTWLFSSAQDRISTGPAAKMAPVVTAVGLYLASQCFMGML